MEGEYSTSSDTKGVIITIKINKDEAPSFLHIFVGNYHTDEMTTNAIITNNEDVTPLDTIQMYNSLVGTKPYFWVDREANIFCRFSKRLCGDDIHISIRICIPKIFVRCVQKSEYDSINALLANKQFMSLSELACASDNPKKVYLTDEQDFHSITKAEDAVRRFALPSFPYGYVKFEIDAFGKMNFEIMSPDPGVVKEDFEMPGGGVEYLVTVTPNDSVTVRNIQLSMFDNCKSYCYMLNVLEYSDDYHICIGQQLIEKGKSIEARRLYLGDTFIQEKELTVDDVFDDAFFAITDLRVDSQDHLRKYSNIVYCVANGINEHKYDLFLLFSETIKKAITLNEVDRNRFLKNRYMKLMTVMPYIDSEGTYFSRG